MTEKSIDCRKWLSSKSKFSIFCEAYRHTHTHTHPVFFTVAKVFWVVVRVF